MVDVSKVGKVHKVDKASIRRADTVKKMNSQGDRPPEHHYHRSQKHVEKKSEPISGPDRDVSDTQLPDQVLTVSDEQRQRLVAIVNEIKTAHPELAGYLKNKPEYKRTELSRLEAFIDGLSSSAGRSTVSQDPPIDSPAKSVNSHNPFTSSITKAEPAKDLTKHAHSGSITVLKASDSKHKESDHLDPKIFSKNTSIIARAYPPSQERDHQPKLNIPAQLPSTEKKVTAR